LNRRRFARVVLAAVAAGVLSCLAALLVARIVPWTADAAASFGSRRAERERIAGPVAEAKRLGLTWESVIVAPQTSAGKPVLWCVDNLGGGRAYVDGRPSEPVRIENPGAMDAPSSKVHCRSTLAVVTGGGGGVAVIRFIAYP